MRLYPIAQKELLLVKKWPPNVMLFIITILPNPPDVKKVVLGKEGVIEGVKKASFN